ncbi:hypothetical protein QBC38DRAFT_460920 [Podospora fimiseda]|uniref:F-box domain-containing protein n=1 Tax=Podospora fimiseda TaxID=252190 RepID=A0AAN6YND2_9PEZI|nr:hypothetical protein QBC38DRAFT_460920 [Podospora fimiseda]
MEEDTNPENMALTNHSRPESKITRLPPELVSQVFQQLREDPKSISPKELNDLCNLRHACKYFANVGSEYTIKTVLQKFSGDWTRLAVLFTRRDLERLGNLTSDPRLKNMAAKVRMLFFVGWAANPDMASEIDKYYESTLRYETGPWVPMDKSKHPPIDESPEAKEAWCQRFRDLVEEQHDIKAQMSAMLHQVLPSLTGLLNFYYQAGGMNNNPATRSRHTSLSPLQPKAAFGAKRGWNQIQRPGHDVELIYICLRAFIKQKVTLRSMSLAWLDWSFFHVKNTHGLPKILETDLFTDLYHFTLWMNNSFSAIDLSTGCKWKKKSGKEEENNSAAGGCAHEIVSSGIVAEFLESMEHLRTLSIHFPGCGYSKKYFNLPAPKLEWVVPIEKRWRYLDDLHIGGVLCSLEELEYLVQNHKKRLRKIKLSHIRLVGSTIRNLLVTLHRDFPDITEFWIDGLCIGNLDEYGLPLGTVPEDRWSINGALEKKISKWFTSPRLWWREYEEEYCPLDDWENGK